MRPGKTGGYDPVAMGKFVTCVRTVFKYASDDGHTDRPLSFGRAFARPAKKLTLFLHAPGAPLDNNLCERALKKAILHRKNSLFYKTPNGARAGDMYMSLIHTCELCDVSAVDYLTELHRHADALAAHPEQWLPWNYRATLETLASAA